jgi:hypothetical protein
MIRHTENGKNTTDLCWEFGLQFKRSGKTEPQLLVRWNILNPESSCFESLDEVRSARC